MKIVEVCEKNKESLELIDKDNKKELIKSFMDANSQSDPNTIFSCILGVENNSIKNYSIYTGTRDTGLVQMAVENLANKSFLEESIRYAFNNLNAYTITIFTDKPNQLLEKEGFENLGNDNNVYTYIKDKEIEKNVGRVRI